MITGGNYFWWTVPTLLCDEGKRMVMYPYNDFQKQTLIYYLLVLTLTVGAYFESSSWSENLNHLT